MILQYHRYYSQNLLSSPGMLTLNLAELGCYINHPANLPTIQLADASK